MRSHRVNAASRGRGTTKGAINSNLACEPTAEKHAIVHPALTLLVGDLSTTGASSLGGEVNVDLTTGVREDRVTDRAW